MMRWIALLLLVAFAVSSAESATTYYVNEDTGSDAYTEAQAQSASTPWLSIEKALQTCDGTTPITIYVKLPADGTFNEADSVTTDASCEAKDVTVEGYTTTPGDGSVGSVPVVVACGGATGIALTQSTGSMTFKYLDLSMTGADSSGDTLFVPGNNQVSDTFDSCILRRSASQSTSGAPLMTYSSGIIPTRTFTLRDCQIIDYAAGSHTAGLFLPGEWAEFVIDGCTFSGSPAGGIGYAFQFIYDIKKVTMTDCVSTLHMNDYNHAFLYWSDNISPGGEEIYIANCTMSDSLLYCHDDDDGGVANVSVINCTVNCDGRAFGVGAGGGSPTGYGFVRYIGNTVICDNEHASEDHGIGILAGVVSSEVAYNTIICEGTVEYPIILKSSSMSFHHNIFVGRMISCAGVRALITNNTIIQNIDNNRGAIDIKSNSAGAEEDVWSEYCVIRDNIIDASAGSYCLNIFDDSITYAPPIGIYRTIVDGNLYKPGADGLAYILGTTCADADPNVALTELRAAWVAQRKLSYDSAASTATCVGTTMTDASETFTSWMVGGIVTFDTSNTNYVIVSVDSATQLTLAADATADNGNTYAIYAAGTPPYNDSTSEVVADFGFWDATNNDYRLFRNSQAISNDPNDFNNTKGAWNRASGGSSPWWQHRRLGL